jgi:hypothetical protein
VATVAIAPPAVAAPHTATPAAFPTILFFAFSAVNSAQSSTASLIHLTCPKVTPAAIKVPAVAIVPAAVFKSLPMDLVNY